MKQTYDEFKKEVVNNIKNYLPESYANAVVTTQHITKMNANYEGLIVDRGQSVRPSINLEATYEEYKDGSLEEAISQIAQIVENTNINMKTDWMLDYNQAKNHLIVRVDNAERNRELLRNAPHKNIADLALTYHLEINDRERKGTVLIRNELLERYGISEEQLHKDALANTQRKYPACFNPMIDEMRNLFTGNRIQEGFKPINKEYPFSILTNSTPNNYGASTLFYPDTMDKIAEQVNGDFYVVPMSVHEVLIAPTRLNFDLNKMAQTVKDTNQNVVGAESILSDSIYRYDTNSKSLKLAELKTEKETMKRNNNLNIYGTTEEDLIKIAIDLDNLWEEEDPYEYADSALPNDIEMAVEKLKTEKGVDEFINSMNYVIDPDNENEKQIVEKAKFIKHNLTELKNNMLLSNYEKIKDKLYVDVTNKSNFEKGECLPFKRYADLYMTYRINFGKDEYNRIVSRKVDVEMMEQWGISYDQLNKDALASAEKMFPAEEIGSNSPVCGILGNFNSKFPAAVFYPSEIEKLTNQFNGDIVITPYADSICPVRKADEGYFREHLNKVQSKFYDRSDNHFPNSLLSDTPYIYHAKSKQWQRLDDFMGIERVTCMSLNVDDKNIDKEDRFKPITIEKDASLYCEVIGCDLTDSKILSVDGQDYLFVVDDYGAVEGKKPSVANSETGMGMLYGNTLIFGLDENHEIRSLTPMEIDDLKDYCNETDDELPCFKYEDGNDYKFNKNLD